LILQARAARDSKQRARAKVSITALIALFAIAGGVQALAPASAVAMVKLGSGCVQTSGGIYQDPATGELCDPTEEPGGGETIEIEVEYTPPACAPDDLVCGLPDGGGRPQPPQGPDSGSPAQPKGSGPTSTPTPSIEEICQKLGEVGKIWSPPEVWRDAPRDRIKALQNRADQLMKKWEDDDLDLSEHRELSSIPRKINTLRKQIKRLEGARKEWKDKGCASHLDE
jgi:hypothetical protein